MSESERERVQRERREADAGERSAEQRQKAFKLAGIAGVTAILVLAVLIVASQAGSGGEADTEGLFTGLPQQGTVLGEPDAEPMLVEYGDMQCPHCRDFSQDVMPEIIEERVRAGELRVDFRNWIVIGPGSILAAKAALAASEQGLYWEYLDSFFAVPGRPVDIGSLREVAEEAGVADLAAWEESIDDPRWDERLERVDEEARGLGFEGTPAFAIDEGDGELRPIDPPGSAEDLDIAGASGGE